MRQMRLANQLEIFHLNRGETSWLYSEIFVNDCYFRNGIRLPPHATVVDVGANIGMFALRVAQLCPTAKIHAFEPVPQIYEVLRANMELHRTGAQTYLCGLSDHTGTADFTFYPHNSIMSGRYAEPEADRNTTWTSIVNQHGLTMAERASPRLAGLFQAEPMTCSLRRLSDVLGGPALDSIDLLKIDVEKSEAEVLAGIDDQTWSRIQQVVVEVHDEGGRLERIRQELASRGFRLVVEQPAAFVHTQLYNIYATRWG